MGATQIVNAAAGEDLIGIDPRLLQQPNAGWLERLALFTGRTLSDTALSQEQTYRSGRLTLLGQAVTQGVVKGLDLSIDLSVKDPVISVASGYGISATGQDVTLLRAMKTTLGSVAVINGDNGAQLAATFSSWTPPAASQPWAGILLLQGVLAAVAGSVVNSSSGNVVSGNLDFSCSQDPAANAFSDPQIVDAAQLVFVTWPSSLAMPDALPAANWRNRLAYTVFDAELALDPDDRLPWEFFGVPLALMAFDASAIPLFADRATVVRTGGLPRRRYIVPFGDSQQNLVPVQPALANARVSQFAEQLGGLLPASPLSGLIAEQFAFLPPGGILPTYTTDLSGRVAGWCPDGWSISAIPVYTEEVEGLLQASVTAAPFDITQQETIEILVPLPDQYYDPAILTPEVVAPVFEQEVDAATQVRNAVLSHRRAIQLEFNALAPLAVQPTIDVTAGLTSDESGFLDNAAAYTPLTNETFATLPTDATATAYISTDLQNLQSQAQGATYNPTYSDANGGSVALPLFSTADLGLLQSNGIQYFIDYINSKLDKANDLLDLAFLTTQTDIYRYRQGVLNSTDATRLAVSPILANIATGVTATATAQNIQDYLASLKTAPYIKPFTPMPAVAAEAPAASVKATKSPRAAASPKAAVSAFTFKQPVNSLVNPALVSNAFTDISAANVAQVTRVQPFLPIQIGTIKQPAAPIDVTGQSPVIGAQLDLRTLTIGERLAQSLPQEALLYATANRASFMQLLAELDITIDDLPILVDAVPAGVQPPVMADFHPTSARYQQVATWVANPTIAPVAGTDADETLYFSTGIHVIEQHSQLLRAVEGRIQLYQNFLTLCASSLANVQSNLQSAQSLSSQLDNDLTNARQDLAFATMLLADESARVDSVNTERTNVLENYVPFIAYHRPRTVINQPSVFSRQLVPANVASPVPACLNQTLTVPPELREMVSLVREAPVSWIPLVASQLVNLERPALLLGLASDVQVRAAAQLSSPMQVSSAASSTGIFAPRIASTYSSNLLMIRTLQTQRATLQTSTLTGQSWSAQIGVLSNVVAVADLQYSSYVHAEIANAAALAMQQISSVATCLYTRIGLALPIDRLTWCQFLEAQPSTSLQNLAILPGWNSQEYVDRQQMQLLVDWLFQQIDSTNPSMVALMNDVVAVAILLASDAPVDSIIAGAVAAGTKPVVGKPIQLTLPSDRITHGMYVNLYSAGTLAARAVVSDLDTSSVTATVTDVYNPNLSLAANDVAHYTTKLPDAVVYKAFS